MTEHFQINVRNVHPGDELLVAGRLKGPVYVDPLFKPAKTILHQTKLPDSPGAPTEAIFTFSKGHIMAHTDIEVRIKSKNGKSLVYDIKDDEIKGSSQITCMRGVLKLGDPRKDTATRNGDGKLILHLDYEALIKLREKVGSDKVFLDMVRRYYQVETDGRGNQYIGEIDARYEVQKKEDLEKSKKKFMEEYPNPFEDLGLGTSTSSYQVPQGILGQIMNPSLIKELVDFGKEQEQNLLFGKQKTSDPSLLSAMQNPPMSGKEQSSLNKTQDSITVLTGLAGYRSLDQALKEQAAQLKEQKETNKLE